MKKALAIISLVLVFVMLASIPSFAEGYTFVWEDPKDITKYYATDITGKEVPVIDGEIKEGEYGTPIVITDNYLTIDPADVNNGNKIIDDYDQPASDKFEYYFSYDKDYIYIAFKDYGGTWEKGSTTANFLDNHAGVTDGYKNFATRANYYITLGFFLDDAKTTLTLGCSSRGFDESRLHDMGKSIGTISDANEVVEQLYMRRYLAKDGTIITKCDNNGSLIEGVKGNENCFEGQYIAECEIKVAKSRVIEILNENFFTEYVELGNACWLYATNRQYVSKLNSNETYGGGVTAYNRYFSKDIRSNKADYGDYGINEGDAKDTIGSLLVFAPEGTPIEMCKEASEVATEPAATEPAATEPAATEPAATEPAATEPAVTELAATEPAATEPAATEPAATEPAATEPAAEGGCGGAVSFAGLALVAALGTCTVFVAKKKED